MGDKIYNRLIVGISVVLAMGLGLFLGKSSSSQKIEPKDPGHAPLVLVPKASKGTCQARCCASA